MPGLPQTKAQRTIEPNKNALSAAIDGYRARAAAVGYTVDRVITTYEAGWSGFWLARWLVAQGVEVHVVQPSSVPVDRRLRRAKSDGIDAELLLRTLLAWLRGEPRVCSMAPIPDEADEDARRCVRERTELLSDRVGLTNRIGAVLATLGVNDYSPLLQSRRRRLAELRTGLGEPIPPNALAKIERLLARLELVLAQIAELEREPDEVAAADAPDRAGKMIQQLASLRGIGVQSATVLVREAFVRHCSNGKALGSYAGLTSPYSSGGINREQGIGKAGNRRLRTVMGELAWLWQRNVSALRVTSTSNRASAGSMIFPRCRPHQAVDRNGTALLRTRLRRSTQAQLGIDALGRCLPRGTLLVKGCFEAVVNVSSAVMSVASHVAIPPADRTAPACSPLPDR